MLVALKLVQRQKVYLHGMIKVECTDIGGLKMQHPADDTGHKSVLKVTFTKK